MLFLNQVARNSLQNLMPPKALAASFAPIIIIPNDIASDPQKA